MPAMFLTGTAESADISGLFSIVVSFITGFLGCIVDVIEYIVADAWLALLLVAVPLGFLIFTKAKGIIKFKGKG